MAFFSMKFAYEKLIRWTGNSQWWVLCGVIVGEPLLDAAVESMFQRMNKGKLWKDVEKHLEKVEVAAKK